MKVKNKQKWVNDRTNKNEQNKQMINEKRGTYWIKARTNKQIRIKQTDKLKNNKNILSKMKKKTLEQMNKKEQIKQMNKKNE